MSIYPNIDGLLRERRLKVNDLARLTLIDLRKMKRLFRGDVPINLAEIRLIVDALGQDEDRWGWMFSTKRTDAPEPVIKAAQAKDAIEKLMKAIEAVEV